MQDLFNDPLNRPSRSLRRDALYRASIDAQGRPVIEAVEGRIITLSPDGSIDSARLVGFLHCGHAASAGIGGQCGEPGCLHLSCGQCFAQSRCSRCFKPLCMEHLHQLNTETTVANLCGRCRAEVVRQRRWHGFLRGILSPFIGFDSKRPA